MTNKPEPKQATTPAAEPAPERTAGVEKPEGFSLDRFKSKRAAIIAKAPIQPNALPVMKIADAGD